MNAQGYYKHARSLAPFKAEDALALAREAAELDRLAELKKVRLPFVATYEVLSDGTAPIRLSNGVTVF